MAQSWFSCFQSPRTNKKKVHKNKLASRKPARTFDVEMLEARQLLSGTPTEIVTPDYVQITPKGATSDATAGPTGMTPAEIKSAYGLNSVSFGSTAANGSGTTIAIVDAYSDPNVVSDLHQFDLAFGLSDPTLTQVNENGGSSLPAGNKSWSDEIALDVEWAHAIAPGANILLVEASSASMSDLMTAVNTARNTTGVVAVSMSWGGSEFSGETSYDSDFTTPAGHAPEAFFVSSGDDGAPVEYPAASPNVVSVGGTTLTLSGSSYGSESAWSGSGGGVSAYESQPAYQNGVVTQSSTARTNPDVSYDADPNTGFPVYNSYANSTKDPWGQWGGTSDAAPQWAALTSIADQGRELAGSQPLNGASQLLPTLYSLQSDFHDITTGTTTGTPNYSAGPGYDLATGLGTPEANLLIPALVSGSGSTGGSGGGSQTTAPIAPTTFNVQAASSTSVSINWSLSTGATAYELYEETPTTTSTLVGTYGSTTTSATISNLTAGGTYYFQIVASNNYGNNGTGWVKITLPTTSLSAPGNFKVTAGSSTQANLSWSLSTGATSYEVYEQENGVAVLLGSVGATSTSATVTGLTPGGTYSFEVAADNGTNTTPTGLVSVTLPSSGGLIAPKNFTVAAVTSTETKLSWSASTGATGYAIYYSNGGSPQELGTVNSRTTSVTVTGLTPGSTDEFYVEAYNSTTTASTGWVSVVMPGAQALAAPTNVTATALTSTTGELSWTGSAGATGYAIYYLSGSQSVLVGTVGANTTSVTIDGLGSSSSYSFAVVAFNSTTTSAASSWVTLITPSVTASAKSQAEQVALLFSSIENHLPWE